jgi:signal transduction histidine kinase
MAAAALVGWAIDWKFLVSIRDNYIPMAPSTAISFLLLGLSLFVTVLFPQGRFSLLCAKIFSILVAAVSGIILLQFIAGAGFDLERLFYSGQEKLGAAPVGRMSPVTAVNFIMAASAIFLGISGRGKRKAAGMFAAAALSVGLFLFLGYLYGRPLFYGGKIIPVALTTAAAFIFVGLGALALPGSHAFREYSERLEDMVKERTRDAEEARARAEAANRAKSDFLANMSHELRTPLNSVIGFSEMLEDGIYGVLNEKQKEAVGNIAGSGRHLLSLINDILDLTKVEAGEMELELKSLAVRDVLASSMAIMNERAFKKAITLTLEIDPGADIEMEADERKLKQILFNLISNAVKFTPDGGSVKIEAKKDGDLIEISVSDTGIGIRAEDMEKLFKPFTQVESGYTREYEGTGLGLALSRKLVALHRGRIWVESEYGKGSRFSFSMPIRQTK